MERLREIKFRAWDKQTKKMWYSDDSPLSMKITFASRYIFCRGRSGYDPSAKYIMQYTGLKDRYGKEIWEGDVVEFEASRAKVIWDYDSWVLHWPSGFNRAIQIFEGMSLWNYVEVIGNIYENPELLKETK